jgi:hypothetical protein
MKRGDGRDRVVTHHHRGSVKKTPLKSHLKECWCIAPKENAGFVANMEDVLEVYLRSNDERRPVICMDEHSRYSC